MSSTESHALLMDRNYRVIRHIYDATRKYFLFGRDRLLEQMEIAVGNNVLEVGVGTARNLIKLARKHESFNLCGLDASAEMLKTAQHNIEAQGLTSQIKLTQGLAEETDCKNCFEVSDGFDVIFFSYSLSMIPPWKEALNKALAQLKSSGKLYIVDFWDQRTYFPLFRLALKKWLKFFHVAYQPELMEYLKELQSEKKIELEIEPVGGSYAFIAVVKPVP